MKKPLLHELKRDLLPLVIFTAIAVVIAVGVAMSSNYTRDTGSEIVRYQNSSIACSAVILCILCTVIPVLQFSYRMKQRSVDLWYSLPITRKQLAFVRTAGGLVLTLAPFTLAYWLSAAAIALRGSELYYFYYLPAYGLLLLLGAALFGVNAFLFTRGNTVADGIVFIAAWACALPLVNFCVFMAVPSYEFSVGGEHLIGDALGMLLFTYSPVSTVTNLMHEWIMEGRLEELIEIGNSLASYEYPVQFAFLFALLFGLAESAAAYLSLFLLADRDKSENAAQVSSSWWGYKVIIPVYAIAIYAVLVVGFGVGGGWRIDLLYYTVIAAAVIFVLYFIYRRSFRLKKWDIIMVAVILAAGFLLGCILHGTDLLILRLSEEIDLLSALTGAA